MSINSDVALKKWQPAKNHERQRYRDNLYVRGFLTGRKLFQMRFANYPWIDIGDYPDKSLAQARETTITAKRIYKARAASLEQIRKAVLLSNTAKDFEASLIGTKSTPLNTRALQLLMKCFFIGINSN